jgi:peptidase E
MDHWIIIVYHRTCAELHKCPGYSTKKELVSFKKTSALFRIPSMSSKQHLIEENPAKCKDGQNQING